MTGYIHSFQSMATMEGRGVRAGVFMQGCHTRCAYCHNPDTWRTDGGTRWSVEQLTERIERYRNYYIRGGGVTFTGGEPLVQGEFLSAACKALKSLGYHIAIDTSAGVIPDCIDEIIESANQFIVDVKFSSENGYERYAPGGSLANVRRLLDSVQSSGREIWIRTVVIPNVNDNIAAMDGYIGVAEKYRGITKYELQPYHTMGAYKYAALGIPYPLAGVKNMDKEKCSRLNEYINSRLGL